MNYYKNKKVKIIMDNQLIEEIMGHQGCTVQNLPPKEVD